MNSWHNSKSLRHTFRRRHAVDTAHKDSEMSFVGRLRDADKNQSSRSSQERVLVPFKGNTANYAVHSAKGVQKVSKRVFTAPNL